MIDDSLEEVVWDICHTLSSERKLVTKKTVQMKLAQLGQWSMVDIEKDVINFLNAWRLANVSYNNLERQLQYPKTPYAQEMLEKIYALEEEILQYQTEQAAAKQTILELGKQVTFERSKATNERQEIASQIRSLLAS